MSWAFRPPHRKFSPGSNLKVDYGLSSSSKFIPVRNRSKMLGKAEERRAACEKETQPYISHANTKSRVKTRHAKRYDTLSQSKHILVFCLHLTE